MKHNITLIFTVATLTLSTYFFYESPYLGLIIASIIISFIALVSLGSSLIRFNYFVSSINKGNEKGIALTFDDGPNPEITPQILDLLSKENIKATFFVIGHQLEKNKELLLRIHKEGHTIGNHSFSHTKKQTFFSTSKLNEDITKCSSLIKKIIHHKPLFFRPPFGVTTPRYKRALKQLNLKSIGWSIRSLDTSIKNKLNLYNKVINRISNGSIILFHDTQQITLEVLPDIIDYCKKNGINIVSLPELINCKPYE